MTSENENPDSSLMAVDHPRLVLPLRVGDTLPLHKYSGQNLSMEDLTLRFYCAWADDEEDEMEHLSMNIEEIIRQNRDSGA